MKSIYFLFILLLAILGCNRNAIENKENVAKPKSGNKKMLTIKKQLIHSNKNIESKISDLIENYYPEYDDKNFDSLDVVTQTFVLIINADGQIQNGGMLQFIDNGTGSQFEETIEASKRIKNKALEVLLNDIKDRFPNKTIPKDWDSRRHIIDSLNLANENNTEWEIFWEKSDKKYYSESNEVLKNLISYLEQNANIIN